jgi:hypothetical protein
MASDLSALIQDGLCDTLTSLLAKDAKLKELTKVHEKDFKDSEFLRINSSFNFNKLTTTFSFMIPSSSASFIFNTMMGEHDAEIASTIDDDIMDAIGEFISNISGGLTTTINGAELEDIGSAKFNISGNEVIKNDSINNIDNIYKFNIDLEEKEIIIFILFDAEILPFIENITKSPITEHPDEEIEEVKENSNEINESDSIALENANEEKDTEPSEENIDEELSSEELKNKKLKLLVMIIGGLLTVTIIAGITMYFMGVFDPEPIIIEPEITTTKETKDKVSVIKYKTLKKIDFKVKDINIHRLNIQLEALTKYEILNKEELKAQAIAEKNRLLKLDKETKLLEFHKKNKEEPLQKKQVNKKIKIINKKEILLPVNTDNKKLKFILANSLKYKLFKLLVVKTKTKQARISICNDIEGRSVIYIGPFENDTLQNKMNSLINKQNKEISTTVSNITEEEFDARCNF